MESWCDGEGGQIVIDRRPLFAVWSFAVMVIEWSYCLVSVGRCQFRPVFLMLSALLDSEKYFLLFPKDLDDRWCDFPVKGKLVKIVYLAAKGFQIKKTCIISQDYYYLTFIYKRKKYIENWNLSSPVPALRF